MANYIWSDIISRVAPANPSQADASAIQQARDALFIDTATAFDLTVHGDNVGVPRPDMPISDELYREIVQVLAWRPKTSMATLDALVSAILGSQQWLISNGVRPWKIYEFTNEFVIEVPYALIASTNARASYLHGWSGYAAYTSTTTFTTNGDVTSSSDVTLVGKSVYLRTGDTWDARTISVISYDALTDLTTITISSASVATTGHWFFIPIQGDTVMSQRGDYLATGGFVATYSTAAGPDTPTVTVNGDASMAVDLGHQVILTYGGILNAHVVTAKTDYDPVTSTTVIDVTPDVPGGTTDEVFLKEREAAGGANPPMADRVYLTGLGAYEILEYYLLTLVRAAGVVIRLERV